MQICQSFTKSVLAMCFTKSKIAQDNSVIIAMEVLYFCIMLNFKCHDIEY